MNKVTRKITMTGVALAAGLTMGFAPAAAAFAAPAQGGATAQASDHRSPRGDRLVGYYRSQRDCVKVGRIGQMRDKWDRFDCDRIQRGPKRGWVALTAKWNVRDQHRGPIGHGPQHHGPQGHGPQGHSHR
jgi:hypothetical protein